MEASNLLLSSPPDAQISIESTVNSVLFLPLGRAQNYTFYFQRMDEISSFESSLSTPEMKRT